MNRASNSNILVESTLTNGYNDIYYADEYNSLQEAVDDIPSGGGKLILSASDYILSTSLVIGKPITIEGQGSSDLEMTTHVTTIQTTSGTINMIEFESSNVTLKNVSLINTHALPTAGSGIYVTSGIETPSSPTAYSANFRLDNVSIKGFYDNINIVNSYHWNINMLTSYKAVRYGVYINNLHLLDGGDSNITNSWIYAGGRNSLAGVRHESGGGLKMTNVKFNGTGGLSDGVGDEVLEYSFDCDMDNGAGGNNSAVLNISACSFENYRFGAIRVHNMKDVSITGNEFAAYNYDPESLAMDFFDVEGLIVTGNTVHTTSSERGVEVEDCRDAVFLNVFRNRGGGANYLFTGTRVNNQNLNEELETKNGDGTTTIDWLISRTWNVNFGAQNEVLTFSSPSVACQVTLRLVQDSVGSRTATFPASVKWVGGVAPVLTTTATTGTDVFKFYFDGTDYLEVGKFLDVS
jgi:hypothetical protein